MHILNGLKALHGSVWKPYAVRLEEFDSLSPTNLLKAPRLLELSNLSNLGGKRISYERSILIILGLKMLVVNCPLNVSVCGV